MGLAAVGFGFSIAQMGLSMWETNEENKAKEEAIKAQRKAARLKFSAIEDSTNLMKSANMEASYNAVGEVLRVGSAKSRDTKEAIDTAASTTLAQSEGLTSGRSKGRQMSALYRKGNKELAKVDAKTSSIINQVIDTQDKMTNDLNNRLIGAHQELTAVLANEGTVIDSTVSSIQAGLGGFSMGIDLYSAFN